MCGVGGVEVEAVGAVACGVGVGVELRELPVFEQGFSSDAERDVGVESFLEGFADDAGCPVFDGFVAGHVAQGDDGPEEVGAFVGPVEGSVAMVEELDSCRDAPVACEAVGGMCASREID